MKPLDEEQQKKLITKIDLSGIENWEKADQDLVKQLFTDFGRCFTLDSNDLGHTNKVKHKIRLNDYTPFKERYQRIPPHMYEEVRKHLKEMLEIGAIKQSDSPWASAIVLV